MIELTAHLAGGNELSPEQADRAVDFLLSPLGEEAAKAGFLQALHSKGETAAEIAAFVRSMLRHAVDPGIDPASLQGPMIDVCGTGGDRMELFNISTTAMFVLAAGGAVVVKHGNRGVTSRCGGADVLEELGVEIDLPPAALRESVSRTGLGFLFAPSYHPAFKAVGPVRRALAAQGATTIFNILGPLLNPARPPFQLVGVFARSLLPKFAGAFQILNRNQAWAVHGAGPDGEGVDEFSTMGETEIFKVSSAGVEQATVLPEHLGIARADLAGLRGGGKVENAQIVTGILDGSIGGAKRDVTVLNAAAGFVITGLAPDLPAGLDRAREAIDNGQALAKLKALRSLRNE